MKKTYTSPTQIESTSVVRETKSPGPPMTEGSGFSDPSTGRVGFYL